MENSKTDNESLIAGFLTDSLSKDEMKKLTGWLDEDPSHRKEFVVLRSAWIMAGYETGVQSFDSRSGWLTVDRRIKKGEKLWIKRFAPLWYAASLLICFALGTTAALLVTRGEPVQSDTQAVAASTTIYAPLGAKSNITLPDGSSVWLNAGSTVSYSSGFGVENRDLQLTGEAFFDVKSDSLNPFNVHTSGITVKAFGTLFNVRAYPDDPTLVATLEKGRIDVVIQSSSGGTTSSQTVQLKPKEQLVIRKTSKTIEAEMPAPVRVQETIQATVPPEPVFEEMIIKPNVITELSTSWKDRHWIIRDEPLALFAENLERRYNLRISFASEELKRYNFSGTFENETVEQILTALSLAAPVNYKFDKNNVVLSLNLKDRDKFDKVLKSNK
jgi:ferric-dicitrate binding protein FerR (iron transport regulator)